MTPIRINLYGGPGVGKSTLAAQIFARLKKQGHKIELVQEFIKTWAWQGRKAKDFDQLYIFAQQMERELCLLRAGVSIITDSPLLLNLAYVKLYNPWLFDPLLSVLKLYQQRWPSLDFIIQSGAVPYDQAGHYESPELAETTHQLIDELTTKELGGNLMLVDPTKHEDFVFAHSNVALLKRRLG